MYKCGLFDCDGAWGTSYEFSFHLLDRKHYESYATEVLKMKLRDVTALKDSELQVSFLISCFTVGIQIPDKYIYQTIKCV